MSPSCTSRSTRRRVFPGVTAENHRGRLVIAPSPDHVERAFNPSKYGEFSPEPVMEITLPSLADPSLAPSGACVLSANVQYAPYALKEGWATGKPKFLDGDHGRARALCAGHRQERASRRTADAGRHRDALPHAGRPLAPRRIAGRPDADVAAGLRARPATTRRSSGCSSAGAGSHPGGGISGVPGLNAARRIIAMRG